MKPTARQFVKHNLGIDYDSTLFEKGLEWLDNFWFGNDKAVQMMSRSKVFWNWWASQWRIRTEQCIYGGGFDLKDTYISEYGKKVLTVAYYKSHDIKNSRRIYPTRPMRDLMIQIKQELKPAKQ